MATFTKTGETSVADWVIHGDSTSTISSVAHSLMFVGLGALAHKPIKDTVMKIINPQPNSSNLSASRIVDQGSTRLIA